MKAPQRQCAAAAEWLRNHELCKGDYWQDEMGNPIEEDRELVEMACLVGSLMIVETHDDEWDSETTEDACTLVSTWLESIGLQDASYSLMSYSDEATTTREDVINALLGGAEVEEAAS